MSNTELHPWSGLYTMRLTGEPTYAVWFKTDDESKPNFFLDSTMFRPQLHTAFEKGVEYGVNLSFEPRLSDNPKLERLTYGRTGTAGYFFYNR